MELNNYEWISTQKLLLRWRVRIGRWLFKVEWCGGRLDGDRATLAKDAWLIVFVFSVFLVISIPSIYRRWGHEALHRDQWFPWKTLWWYSREMLMVLIIINYRHNIWFIPHRMQTVIPQKTRFMSLFIGGHRGLERITQPD